MSRKTKEEKKLAEYRRRLKHLQQAVQTENLNQPKKSNLVEESRPKEKKSDQVVDPSHKFFNQDLKKSLLFIFLIITLEFIIYFVRIKIY